MVKNLVDLEIKRFDEEDLSFNCHPENPSDHYFLRFRCFYPDGSGSEEEHWFRTLSSCIFRLIEYLAFYAFCYESVDDNNR